MGPGAAHWTLAQLGVERLVYRMGAAVIIALVSSPDGEDFYVAVPSELWAWMSWDGFVLGVWDLGA